MSPSLQKHVGLSTYGLGMYRGYAKEWMHVKVKGTWHYVFDYQLGLRDCLIYRLLSGRTGVAFKGEWRQVPPKYRVVTNLQGEIVQTYGGDSREGIVAQEMYASAKASLDAALAAHGLLGKDRP